MRGREIAVLGTAVLAAVLARGALAAPPKRTPAPVTQTVPDAPYPDEFKARVKAEIERGAAKLLRDLEGKPAMRDVPRGVVGERALVLLTLLKCGIPKDTPALVAAIQAMRAAPPRRTYDVGVVLMALAARYDGPFDPFATDLVDAAGRHAVPPPTTDALDPEDREAMTAAVAFLVDSQRPWIAPLSGASPTPPVPPAEPEKGARPTKKTTPSERPEPPKGWGYPGGLGNRAQDDYIDVSNVQYALLGLKAASRCGLPVPPATWSAALSLLLEWQAQEGESVEWRGNEVRGPNRIEWSEAAQARGFAYTAPARDGLLVTGGRTAAGAVGLMICQSELWNSPKFTPAVQARTRAAVRDAIAWMQANFDPDHNPGDSYLARLLKGAKIPVRLRDYEPYLTSYLYATERMGVLAHLRFLGEHDWYREGAEGILAHRAKRDAVALLSVTDDCFELLFLKRASFRTSMPVVTPDPVPAMDGPAAGPAPEKPPGK